MLDAKIDSCRKTACITDKLTPALAINLDGEAALIISESDPLYKVLKFYKEYIENNPTSSADYIALCLSAYAPVEN